MIELHADRTDEVYKSLATTGRYFNTGKVLIGVSCEPRPRSLSYGEERIQSALLSNQKPRITAGTWGYMALVAGVLVGIFMACTT
jgi:hypothetical protein